MSGHKRDGEYPRRRDDRAVERVVEFEGGHFEVWPHALVEGLDADGVARVEQCCSGEFICGAGNGP
jgi:hypothetical protein